MRYEQLIVNTSETLSQIYRFLDLNVDAHKFDLADHKNGIDAVLKKVLIRRETLFAWLNAFPKSLVYVADKLAPIMTTLGYDTSKIVPNNQAYEFNHT